jgi:hypothetical protein
MMMMIKNIRKLSQNVILGLVAFPSLVGERGRVRVEI